MLTVVPAWSHDCRVLGNGYLTGEYAGDCDEHTERAQGQGEARGADTYVGSFAKGKPDGKGTYTWENGARLDGNFKDGKAHGTGVFTSANGVRFFLERLDRSGADWRSLRAKICAIGPATRAAIQSLHLKVDLMGKEYVAESLVEAFASHDLARQRVLLPRAAVARDLVPAELGRRGARVDVVEAYRTGIPEDARARAAEIFCAQRKPDWITFTSSSTVRNFAHVAPANALEGVKVASIGPVTSETARRCGIQVTAEARVYTTDGVVEAILEWAANARECTRI